MTKIAEMLGRVMMTAVTLPRTKQQEELRWYTKIEYNQDSNYVYNRLISGQGLPK